ncbi:hypothetical protein LTS18_007757, partial [Coniosporium uncinatum]
MNDLIRDAPVGQIIRYVIKNRLFQYPEEKPDWQCPSSYAHPDQKNTSETVPDELPIVPDIEIVETVNGRLEEVETPPSHSSMERQCERVDLEKIETARDGEEPHYEGIKLAH